MAFLAASTGEGRKPIAEILKEYQVTPDPEGMVEFPSGALGWIAERFGMDPKRMTAGEAELLKDLGIGGIKDAYDIYEVAEESGGTAFGGKGETDGHADAFRHAYWNALLTNRFGEEWTESYTTAHERLGGEERNAATVEAMDLYNNEVGRKIAMQHPDATPDELANHVEETIRNGEMMVHNQSGQLAYSDQVKPGDTGLATGPRHDGGHDPQPAEETWAGGYNPGSDAEDYGTTRNY